jgi:N-formylglutamate amidohydrolase
MPTVTKTIPQVLRRTDPDGPPAPLVFDSPHTGMAFPDDFQPAIPLAQCERVSDWFIEDLFGEAAPQGAIFLEALFRRAYLDPNRSPADLDTTMIDGEWPDPVEATEKTARGASLIWRVIDGETPIYGRKLTVDEVRRRIDTYWRPYHAELKSALDQVHTLHGRVFHVNCHSMPEWGDVRVGDQNKRRSDFIIGTRDGTTASAAFTDVVVESLRSSGYSVTVNDRFKGVELIRRYSDPANRRESLQIEVNRGIYMNEAAITRTERYGATKSAITKMIQAVREYAAR